jgi:hydroxymethylbilane synthase
LIPKFAHTSKDSFKTLEGGCTAPIGALAVFVEDDIVFKESFSLDGNKNIEKPFQCKNGKN